MNCVSPVSAKLVAVVVDDADAESAFVGLSHCDSNKNRQLASMTRPILFMIKPISFNCVKVPSG